MKRLSLKLFVAAAAVLATAVVALAFYSTAGTGANQGVGTTGSLTAAAISVPSTSSGSPTITWTQQASLSDTSKNSQITYTVERKTGTGSFVPLASGGCASPAYNTASCVDTTATSGSFTYQVVAKFRGWNAVSAPTGPVTITPADPAPTVTSIARSGATTTDAATVAFTVTFSENVTGVDATDFAVAATGVTGAAVVSPISGSNSSYSVTVSTGSGSGTIGLNLVDDDTITDGDGNKLGGTGLGNGNFTGPDLFTIDKPSVASISRQSAENPTNDLSVTWRVTFSEAVSGVDSTDFTRVSDGDIVPGAIGTPTAVGGSSSAAAWDVPVATGTGVAGTIGLNLTDNDSIIDTGGRRLGGAGNGNGNSVGGEPFTIDKRAPQLLTLEMTETGTPDGRIDQVTATFDDTLNEADASVVTGWSFANIPGAVTLSSVSVVGTTATLNFTGGTAGSQSTTTALGNNLFTVTLSNSTGQIRDALGNKSGFAQTPTDKAGPVPFDFSDEDAATSGGQLANNGLFQLNDVLTVFFTEPLAEYDTTTAGPDAIVRNGTPGATGNDAVSLPGTLDNAFTTLNRTDYLTNPTDALTATFPGARASRATGNNDRHKIEITLGSTACAPAANCAFLTKPAAAANYTYVPPAAIKDQSPAANAAAGSFTKSALLF